MLNVTDDKTIIISVPVYLDPAKKQFWDGTQRIFVGQNGAYLYSLIKNNKFDWKYLTVEYATIGRSYWLE